MMKKYLYLALAILLLAGCKQQPAEQKVMARYVPERSDDFVFENNLIAGRFYGEALEGNPTSPGIDVWVKLPGKLVADEWYAKAQEDPEYYHHDHGGKDCYKVSVSLGGGASAPLIDGRLVFPATNYRSWEINEQAPDKVVFTLHYPEWETAEGIKLSLDKQVTVEADSYFCRVDDTWSFSGVDSLTVAAGVFLHGELETLTNDMRGLGVHAIWENASDQSIEPEDGMIGVAVFVPGGKNVRMDEELDHGIVTRTIGPGEVFTYYFGSCWSKGDLKTPNAWFDEVKKLQ